jgi:CRISPR-associated protein Cas2
MYVIIAYDVGVERVNKVKSYLRTQLTWVQNSLFEGEITESRYMEIKMNLLSLIDKENDSVVIYKFATNKLFERENFGLKKGDPNEVVL